MKDIIDFIIKFFKALYRTFLFLLKSKKAKTKETERLIKTLSPKLEEYYKPWFKKYFYLKKAYKKVPTIQV